MIDICDIVMADVHKNDWEVWCILMWMVCSYRPNIEHGSPVVGKSVGVVQATDLVSVFQEVHFQPLFDFNLGLVIGKQFGDPRLREVSTGSRTAGLFGVGGVIRDIMSSFTGLGQTTFSKLRCWWPFVVLLSGRNFFQPLYQSGSLLQDVFDHAPWCMLGLLITILS